MNWFATLRRRACALFKKKELNAQMDDEIRFHIEMLTQENVRWALDDSTFSIS